MADKRAFSLAGDENFPGCVSLFVVVKFFTFAESVALHTHQFCLLFNSPTNSRVFLLPLFRSLLQEFFFSLLFQSYTKGHSYQPYTNLAALQIILDDVPWGKVLKTKWRTAAGLFYKITATGHAAVPGYVVICIIC